MFHLAQRVQVWSLNKNKPKCHLAQRENKKMAKFSPFFYVWKKAVIFVWKILRVSDILKVKECIYDKSI